MNSNIDPGNHIVDEFNPFDHIFLIRQPLAGAFIWCTFSAVDNDKEKFRKKIDKLKEEGKERIDEFKEKVKDTAAGIKTSAKERMIGKIRSKIEKHQKKITNKEAVQGAEAAKA